MTRSRRFELLTGVALPLLLAGPATGIAEETSAATPIVVVQADAVAAAQTEVKAAKAALREAQKGGGDVAAAQARLDSALKALAAAKAAQGPAAPPPKPPAQSETQQQQASPPEPPPEQAAPVQQAPSDSQTNETPAQETPPAVEELPPQQPQVPPPSSGESSPPPEPPVLPDQAQPKGPPSEQPAQSGQQAQPKAPAAEQPAQAGAQPEVQAPPKESAVESQLKVQGDKQDLENVRALRDKLRQELAPGEPDSGGGEARQSSGLENGRVREGDRRDHQRPPSNEGDVVLDFGLGFVVQLGDQLVIRRDSASETERFLDRARDVNVEHFRGGYTRTVVTRRDGTRIYTVRNQYGDIITRTRVTPNGNRVVLIDNRDFYRDGHRPRYGHNDRNLPPLRINIPQDQYVVETSRSGRNDIHAALMAPPVEAVEHPYSLEEVRTSRRLRDKLRRVDLNTITFDFGSAAISPSQFDELAAVGTAIEDILARSPNEIFLVEGYTDAVGSPTNNLILSDQRAEAIAVALSSNFAIPPENLVTQGYGEQYLKVDTQEAERENRRVTVQRITPLVAQSSTAAQ